MDFDKDTIDAVEDWARETLGVTDVEEIAEEIEYDNENELVDTLQSVSDDTLGGFE